MKTATNLLLFQLGWFSCVLLRSWWAIVVVAVVLFVHMLLTSNRSAELFFITIVTVAGSLLDSILMWAGLFVFEDSSMLPVEARDVLSFLCPLWLVGIWIAFATTIGTTARLLGDRQWLAPFLGAIAAPLAYFAGARLGAVQFGWSTLASMMLLAIVWAFVFPLVLKLHRSMVTA